MHELGVCFTVIDRVEEIAKENNVKKITKLTLEIGELSTVIPSYLEDVYKWAILKSDVLKESTLEIIVIKAINICNLCGNSFSAKTHGKICPKCQSESTYLLEGNEFNIRQIEVED